MADHSALSRLQDYQQLTQLLGVFARHCDWLDIAGLKGCFEAGAFVRFGAHAMSADDFCDFWGKMGSGFKARHHLIGVPVIVFTGDDEAFVEAPAIVAGTKADVGARLRDFMECDRYVFTGKRRDTGWLFAEARFYISWSQGGPTPTGMEAGGALDHDLTIDNPGYVRLA